MKRTGLVFIALLCTIVTVIVSCSKTSEDKLNPVSRTTCDTTNSTFTTNVLPILKANCYSCHGNGDVNGGVNFDTYANVKIAAQSGALLGTITHAAGYPAMPDGLPQLSTCDINTIRSWINNGTLNN